MFTRPLVADLTSSVNATLLYQVTHKTQKTDLLHRRKSNRRAKSTVSHLHLNANTMRYVFLQAGRYEGHSQVCGSPIQKWKSGSLQDKTSFTSTPEPSPTVRCHQEGYPEGHACGRRDRFPLPGPLPSAFAAALDDALPLPAPLASSSACNAADSLAMPSLRRASSTKCTQMLALAGASAASGSNLWFFMMFPSRPQRSASATPSP